MHLSPNALNKHLVLRKPKPYAYLFTFHREISSFGIRTPTKEVLMGPDTKYKGFVTVSDCLITNEHKFEHHPNMDIQDRIPHNATRHVCKSPSPSHVSTKLQPSQKSYLSTGSITRDTPSPLFEPISTWRGDGRDMDGAVSSQAGY